MKKKEDLLPVVVRLIQEKNIATQAELVAALNQYGYKTNQSKVSRLLHKLPITKVKSHKGKLIYSLPLEPAPPPTQASLTQLIIDIVANETLIAIHTSPGSAALIARVLDYKHKNSLVLATLAGDDTVFVMPKSIKKIKQTLDEVYQQLMRLQT